jgi:hypothetical protein
MPMERFSQLALASEPHTAEQAGRHAAGSSYATRSGGAPCQERWLTPTVCQQDRGLPLNRAAKSRSGGLAFPYVNYMRAFRPPGAAVRLPLEGVPSRYPATPFARQQNLTRPCTFDPPSRASPIFRITKWLGVLAFARARVA